MNSVSGPGGPAPLILGDLERTFINRYQGDFPLVERPFAAVAQALGTDEERLILMIQGLLERGLLTRFGPLFDAERLGGRFTLAAMAVPEADFDRVAAQLAALPRLPTTTGAIMPSTCGVCSPPPVSSRCDRQWLISRT
jgi:DNA-binding Lrp family transcriptional regulator